MGREIKRIALDFDYPIGKMIWKGYHNPYRGLKCPTCDGTGMSQEYKELDDAWYDFDNKGIKWCYNINQEEVDELVKEGRLWDFTRVPLNEEQQKDVQDKMAKGGNSWLPYDNGIIPTAEEVNKWAKDSTFGHDSINKWICVKKRAKNLGITEIDCKHCDGHGDFYPDEKYRELAENFEHIEPPSGDGYQLWSTTTEGTPMSPVFNTPEELAKWLTDNNTSSFGAITASYEEWLVFCKDTQWTPSMISIDGKLTNGINK